MAVWLSPLSTCERDGHLQVWWYQTLYNTILTSWWCVHCARNVLRHIINHYKTRFCALSWLITKIIQSNLGSRTPRIIKNSVYEQIFRTQSVSDDVLCLELRTRKPSTSCKVKLGVSVSVVFVVAWSSGKTHESATTIGESVCCCVAFVDSNSLCLLFK